MDPLHGLIRVSKAKSATGVRVVHIPPPLLPAVEAHLARWSAPGPAGLVFVGPRGGALNSANFGCDFRDARDAVGLGGVTFHDLRHAAGTMPAQTGATGRELMGMLGHASPDDVAPLLACRGATWEGPRRAARTGLEYGV